MTFYDMTTFFDWIGAQGKYQAYLNYIASRGITVAYVFNSGVAYAVGLWNGLLGFSDAPTNTAAVYGGNLQNEPPPETFIPHNYPVGQRLYYEGTQQYFTITGIEYNAGNPVYIMTVDGGAGGSRFYIASVDDNPSWRYNPITPPPVTPPPVTPPPFEPPPVTPPPVTPPPVTPPSLNTLGMMALMVFALSKVKKKRK